MTDKDKYLEKHNKYQEKDINKLNFLKYQSLIHQINY